MAYKIKIINPSPKRLTQKLKLKTRSSANLFWPQKAPFRTKIPSLLFYQLLHIHHVQTTDTDTYGPKKRSTRMRCSEVPHPFLQKVLLCLDLPFLCTNRKFTLYDTQIIVNVFTVHTTTLVNIIMIILPQNSTTDTSCHPSLSQSRCLDDTLPR